MERRTTSRAGTSPSPSDVPHPLANSRTQKKSKKRSNPPLSALPPDICARFPTELHDCIIDHLYDDRRTLIACSLVCSAWSASSRYHLFQNASTIHVFRHNFRQFCELLATQRLNGYIGRLHLESHLFGEELSDGEPYPTFKFNHHLHLLTGLRSLKYLRLDYHHDSLLPAFFAAITQNFRSITDLELSSMHFDSFAQFMRLVESLHLLRRVALDKVVWYDSEDNAPPPTYVPGSKLIDIAADCGNLIPPVLLWLPSQSCIRRLAIGPLYSEAHSALFSDVLRTLGARLEHLIIHDANDSQLPDLSHSTALHTFEITGIQRFEPLSSSINPNLEWVPTLLSQLHSRVLERIVLILHLHDREGLELLDWPRITKVLGCLSSLRLVTVVVSRHKNWATKAIPERLTPRTYALRVGQLEGRYRYSLSIFDG